jgi:uncharacterized protein YhfF
VSWDQQFDDPIVLPGHKPLVTLRDAALFITELPKAEHDAPEWQAAMEALLLVAERNGPTMLARIGMMRAINRHAPPSTKRATCWAESQGLLSAKVGKLMVVLDGQGVPKAVLKTTELTKRRFDEVDQAFAYDEGEGDRTLQYWREAHTRYFTRLGRYAPDMMLWCERFELVERIG